MMDIAITGVGTVTPLGVGARTLHTRWSNGEVGIHEGRGVCRDFNPTDHLTVKEARRADRFTQFALVAGDEALAQAGWSGGIPYDTTRVGTIIGTGTGGISTLESGFGILRDQGPKKVPPLTVPLMMSNAAPAALAMRYGLLGISFGVVSACAAGSHAIGTAASLIRSGAADAVVTGGSEAALTPLATAAFGSLDALSRSGRSLPFDARRDGFVMGEGAGVLVLERADLAHQRGAEIIGYLRGYGATSDAFHLTAPDSDGAGATRAINLALSDAEVEPEEIIYINAHGTATPINDRVETLAIKSAFGDLAPNVPVSSTKSTIGHLLGAAGAVEAVATLLALEEGIAPPTLGWEELDEGLDLDYVPGEAKPMNLNGDRRLALSNSFGFGGHNAVLCLEVTG